MAVAEKMKGFMNVRPIIGSLPRGKVPVFLHIRRSDFLSSPYIFLPQGTSTTDCNGRREGVTASSTLAR